MEQPATRRDPEELLPAALRALGERYPTADAVLDAIASRHAALTLPKGTVHIVSDVHGEARKLKHIINNASGALRPLVERSFAERLSPDERVQLLAFIYYPRESWDHLAPARASEPERRAFVLRTARLLAELLRALARSWDAVSAEARFPEAFRRVFRELLLHVELARSDTFLDALLEPFLQHGRDLDLLRALAHAVRNLSIAELIVAGDLGDRGPRADHVIEYLSRQPAVSFTWGNHDAEWMGACLGHPALIATLVRISLRYGRTEQLEEGYGIPLEPVEKLARTAYADDPAERFHPRGQDLREPLLLARMQKAMALLQFKLEGQAARRNPHFDLEHRCLLHRIDARHGTVTVDGHTYPLLDTRFPTLDPNDPYGLSNAEEECLRALRASFVQSPVLWHHMRFVARRGSTWLRRDHHLIFHGCVPVDAQGAFLPFRVDGDELRGRALFDALDRVVHRAFRHRRLADLDLLWYLWTGPASPLFGKDRMATFETSFLADKNTHKESKNPYFHLLHEENFCAHVLREFDVDPARGLIVNGHVPVKLEKGESPVKKSGRAVTIDGAFSEAYGDKGYTLVLDADRTTLAQHHHFASVEDAVTRGGDIIPTVQDVLVFERPRTVGDTEQGDALRAEIALLEELLHAYEVNVVPERER